MPTFRFTDDSPEGKKKRALVKQILPKEPIVTKFLEPRLQEAMNDVLVKALKQEIEIYKAYPKTGTYNLDEFDPRTPDRCFMGQGFTANGFGVEHWQDADLVEYRNAIGTIDHKEWGNVTLLEIWGGDHFQDYREMVTGVMAYAWGKRKTMPEISFHVNPFYKNQRSGKMLLSERMEEQNAEAVHMNKLSNYLEIRDRLKKARMTNPLNLALDPKDDPTGSTRSRLIEEEDDDE